MSKYAKSSLFCLLLLLLPAGACQNPVAPIDSLTFTCSSDADCMQGFKCKQEICVNEQNVLIDAGTSDISPADTVRPDQAIVDTFTPDTTLADHFVDEDSAVAQDASLNDLGSSDASLFDAENLDSSSEDLANFGDANLVDSTVADTHIDDAQEPDAFVPHCVDQDGDGRDAYDEEKCPDGNDYCDDKNGLIGQPECQACANNDCQDIDGDGYWAGGDLSGTHRHFDCDDSLPSCNDDCTTDADGDEQSDCLEDFCGSNPAASLSTCHLINSVNDWDTAVANAADNGQDDFFLLGNISVPSGYFDTITDSENLTIRQRAGHKIHHNGDSRVFRVNYGGHVTFNGLHIIGGTRSIYIYEGDNCTVNNCIMEGFSDTAIDVNDGDNNTIESNDINCENADLDSTGIYVRYGSSNLISANTLSRCNKGLYILETNNTSMDHNNIVCGGSSQNSSRGIYLYDTSDTTITTSNIYHCEMGIYVYYDNRNVIVDNNSLITNYSAVRFNSSNNREMCIRNNIFSDNGMAFDFSTIPSWTGDPCKVNGSYQFKNNLNGGIMCSGECLAFADSESDCSDCLPTNATFFPHSYDPAFISLDPYEDRAFCPSEAALLELGSDLEYDFIFPYDSAEKIYGGTPPVGSCDLPQ